MPQLTDLNDAYFPAADVNGAPQLIDDDVTFTDAENDFAGGTLVVSGLLAEDIVAILATGNGAGEINVVGANVYFGGTLIGSFAGGAGSSLVVTFNASATSASIETLIESLTYQNNAASPTLARDLTIVVTDAAGNNTLRDLYYQADPQPFDPSFDLPSVARPTLGDLDGDGDLDLIVSDDYGDFYYLENTGTAAAPVFVERTGAANPMDGVNADDPRSTLVDLDGDGDLDLVVGQYAGDIRYFENTGGPGAAVFTERAGGLNPFDGIDIGFGASPGLADLDGDGDLDAVVARANGNLYYFENTGTASAPVFVERTGGANPLNGVGLPGGPNLTMADVDGDGDFDIVVGFAEGPVSFLENIGTAASASFAFTDNRPFENVMSFFWGYAAMGDLDGDGDLELIVGDSTGTLTYYEVDLLPGQAEVIVEAVATPREDNLRTREGVALSGSVFANNGFGADSAGAVVTEVNGQSIDVGQQITLPSGALLTLNADGTYSYDPNGAFDDLPLAGSGGVNSRTTDSFTYTVNGGNTATVTITIRGEDSDDLVLGDAGDNFLKGGIGDDTLDGGDGDDYLRGDTGADTMRGGLGDDTYVVDDAGDVTDETGGDGVDLVISRVSWTLSADIETLTLAPVGGAISGTGNALENLITGNAGANTLQGLDGEDTLLGGGANDILQGGDDGDLLDGGNHNDILEGGAGDDALIGGAGNDLLDGGTGADDMVGGLGNDTYIVDDELDSVTEDADSGTDTVEASITWTLGDNLETLVLTGSDDIGGYGNALRNVITGNSGANEIDGGEGKDVLGGGDGDDLLFGGDDADILNGGDGDDELVGGGGADKLTGGAGADRFTFSTPDVGLSSEGETVYRDEILDLNFADGDIVDLQSLLASEQSFAFVDRFSKQAGEITMRYSGGVTVLQLDVDGDGLADLRIGISGDVSGTKGNLYTGEGDTDGGWIL